MPAGPGRPAVHASRTIAYLHAKWWSRAWLRSSGSRALGSDARASRLPREVVPSLSDRDDVAVLGVNVEEIRFMRSSSPVADALSRHERRVAVLERVDRRGTHTAARGRPA